MFRMNVQNVPCGRRLDIYHTSTHGVTLVRILIAGLKCAESGSLEIQDAKMTQKIAICAPSHKCVGYIFATKACIDNREKLVKQQYVLHMSPQYDELRLINS